MNRTALLSVNAFGPLSDRRLVRGRRVAVNALSTAPPPAGETYQVFYGNDPSRLFDWAELRTTGYGNMVAIFDLPTARPGGRFYYRVVGSKGTVADNGGFPFSQQVHESILSLRMESGRLFLSYAGPAAGPDSRLHSGWNGWKTPFDMGMSYAEYAVPKYASPGGYANAVLEPPFWASSIDFVVFHRDCCDNSGGADWRFNLRPLVQAKVMEKAGDRQNVIISYSGGALKHPVAHYGINGWLETAEAPLAPSPDGQWQASILLNADAATLDLCFRSADGSAWENNDGMNWEFDIR